MMQACCLNSLLNPFLQATMVQKRPFDAAEEMLEVSFKHPKHAGSSDILVPLSDSVIPDDDCYTHLPKTSGWSLVFNLVQFEKCTFQGVSSL
jgi:hypothetical protein